MRTSKPASNDDAPQRRWLLATVLLTTLLIRGGALWALRGNLASDPDGYRQIAEGLRQTGTFTRMLPENAEDASGEAVPTAFRPVLYPLILASAAVDGQVNRAAVAVLHLLFGLATVALVYDLGWRLQLGTWSALAALIVACDPILLNQAALVMTETLATLLAVLTLWLLTRCAPPARWCDLALVGASLGLATLCRPTFLPWLGLVVIGVYCWQGNVRQRLARSIVVTVAALLVLAPWAIRNQVYFGKPIVTTTHGGYTLWLANNDAFYDYLLADTSVAWGVAEDDANEVVSGADELAADRAFQLAAREVIARRPGMFVYSGLVRVGYIWSPLPQKVQASESTYRVLARYVVALWYVSVYGLALVGTWQLRGQLLRAPWVWGIALCIAVTAIHTVYWSNLRMRAPLIPVVALLAAAGASALTSRPAPTLRR